MDTPVSRSALYGKLTKSLFRSLESATTFCKLRANPYVELTHWLHQLIQQPENDIHNVLRHYQITSADVEKALIQQLNILPAGASVINDFSHHIDLSVEKAWMLASIRFGDQKIRSGWLLLAWLTTPELCRVLKNICAPLAELPVDELLDILPSLITSSPELTEMPYDGSDLNSAVPGEASQVFAGESTGSKSALAKYCQDMTALAREGNIDPVTGREHEIRTMTDILLRRRQNNPLLTGEAGVGKTAVVEGFALAIAGGEVPPSLRNVRLLSLDVGALLAGASMKGEFESRLKALLEEAAHSPQPVILFVDEVHTLVGAGGTSGTGDAANLLKPALARGELKTIAATTWSEYKKYFEKDAALSRRFQLVKVSEPNAAEATIILRGLSAVYERSHGVLIDDDALQAAATLSERYLSGRQLPDKAIDVLDTACARVAINLSSPPKQISALTTLSHQQEVEIRQLERELRIGLRTDTSRMTEVLVQYDETLTALDELEAAWHQQQTLVQEIIALRQQLLGVAEDDAAALPDVDAVVDTPPESEQDNTGAVPADDADSEQPEETAETVSPVQRLAQLTAELDALHNDRLLVSPHVDKKQIAAVIAEWTGVPLNRLSQNEMSVITDLPKWLGDIIKGQDLAIVSLHKHLLTARADLRRPGRPLGAFLLAGPSGVGKTETVLQLAELLYGGRQYLTTINMSEFQEKHTVSRLIGSPPGYVGYGEGGVLTEAIRQKPYSVVLLDEVEKAHPDVLNLFYQAFDKGEMADGEGRLIDCKNIVFFLTSNLGYHVIVEHADDPETMQEVLYPVLADFFKPALLARMEVVPYLPLSKETLATIIAGKLARLDNVLRSRFGAEVVIEPEVTDEIMSRVTRAENGARMLESVIDGDMLPPLSLLLLQKMAANTAIARIRLSAVDGAFTADVEDAQNDESVTKDETVL